MFTNLGMCKAMCIVMDMVRPNKLGVFYFYYYSGLELFDLGTFEPAFDSILEQFV